MTMLHCPGAATFSQGQTVLSGSNSNTAIPAVLEFQRRLATAAVSTGTVLGEIQFTGWDGSIDGLGAQIRSVYTVSPILNTG